MPYEEFFFWDRYEYDQNYSPQRETCVCFWKVQGEQDCWDKDIQSFILERERERDTQIEIQKERENNREKRDMLVFSFFRAFALTSC